MHALVRRAAILVTAGAGASVLTAGMVLAGAGPAAASSAVYAAVSATGSGDCSDLADACTLSTALGQVTAGGTIELVTPGGTAHYVGNWSVSTSGTSATAPVTIEAAGGLSSQPVLDGNNGASAGCSTASCDGSVLTVPAGEYVSLSGITIADGNNASGGGGGLDNAGTVTITGSTFTGNTATGDPNPGTASGHGGAIDNGDSGGLGGTGSVTVTGSTFTGNTAWDGGAIDNGDLAGGGGSVTVTASSFTNNKGISGGGAIDNGDRLGDGSVSVTASTFTSNTTTQGGGGAISNGDSGGSGTVQVTASTFASNSAFDGGAISNEGGAAFGHGTVSVTLSTFYRNQATDGGALANGDNTGGADTGTMTVTASTFSLNRATDGTAIDNGDHSGGGTMLVAGNLFDGHCDQAAGTWTDGGYNVGIDGSCLNSGTGDDNAGIAAVELHLGTLADNGGPTQTVAPTAGSPAIGLIPDPTTVTLGGSPVQLCPVPADQRGYPSAANTACDAGSVQTSGTLTLATTPDPAQVTLPTSAALNDSAVLSGGSNPTGTITFTLYDPSNNLVYTDDVPVHGDGTYTTSAGDNPGGVIPTVGGTYQWDAVYSGDTSNNKVSDTNDTAEQVVVSKVSPALATTPDPAQVTLGGSALNDSAALSGGSNPTGTITFTLYDSGNNLVYTDDVPVSGNGTYSTTAGDNPGGFIPAAAGTYQWDATYSGDAVNNKASDTNDAAEQAVVNKASPALTTTPGGTVVTGSALSDSAKLAGGYNPTGSITFTLYNSAGTAVYTDVVPVSGNGTYTTTTPAGHTPTATGTYQWAAAYSGDGNNDVASTGVGDEPQQVTYAVKLLYNPAKANEPGATVPITLELVNASGANVSRRGIVLTVTGLSPSPAPGKAPSGTFTFTAGPPRYQFNVKTTRYPAGTYALSFTAKGDPVTHTAKFIIR